MKISSFIHRQLQLWPEVHTRFDDLAKVRHKTLMVDGIPVQVQFNPARIRSATAKVDSLSVHHRSCFLCAANRPVEQIHMPWRAYHILINPYPILPQHLTIASDQHLPQAIAGRIMDMLALAEFLEGFVILYNGPQCGASAPDHFHFQAVELGHTALEQVMDAWMTHPAALSNEQIQRWEGNCFSGFQLLLSGNHPESIANAFMEILDSLSKESTEEPNMNLLCRYHNGLWQLQIIPRCKHRPDCFFAEGEDQMIISPGVLDMAGVIVTSREKDFERITSSDIKQIYREVAIFKP